MAAFLLLTPKNEGQINFGIKWFIKRLRSKAKLTDMYIKYLQTDRGIIWFVETAALFENQVYSAHVLMMMIFR